MKIMMGCVGLVGLLDFMVVVFVRDRLSSALRQECLVKGRNMAGHLSARSERLVLTEEYVSLLQLATDLRDSDEDIAYVYVADRHGRVLVHTFEGGFPEDLRGVNPLAPGSPGQRVLLDTVEAGFVHDIAVPVLDGKAGSAHVGISEQRIQNTISHFTLVILGIAGLVLLVAVALAGVVSWVIAHPIRSLTEAAREIQRGDLGRQVVATTRDEIGDLVESFNQMSEELQKQHKVLDDRNRRIQIARQQAAGERDKLRAIIDCMVEGVVFVDATGRITLCNESAERIWQTSAQDLLGKPLVACHPPALRPKVARIIARARQTPGFAVTREMSPPQRHSRLSNYSSVHGQDGRYLGLVVISQDLSERVRLEQEQKTLRDQLFQQEKMVLIGQIAASVAHELNTPLGTILLRSQLVRRQLGDEEGTADLKVIDSEAQRCRRIIDSLLGFSRRSEGVMATADLNPLIRDCLALVANDLALRNITLQTDYAHDGAVVRVDIGQIQQVLLNLVTNAADAMPTGGRLRIVTRPLPERNMVEIQVVDKGQGMEPEILARAFDAFFTTKERGKGTGLGLAICQRIIEEHEGEITVESHPGQGTTVSFRLPHAAAGIPVGE
jgi:PAS domain S-box-containing protein